MRQIAPFILAAVLASGCATSFSGKPKIETGPAGCRSICDGWGMELAGMVQMGEYSNGCVCQVRGKPLAVSDAAATALPAVAGVWMEMQRREREAAMSGPVSPGGPFRPGGYRGY